MAVYSKGFIKKILLEHGLLKCELIGCEWEEDINLSHIIPDREGGPIDIDNNLLILCPNHHTRFDKGKLNISPKRILASREWNFEDLLKAEERYKAENVSDEYKERIDNILEVYDKREKDLEEIDISKRGFKKILTDKWGLSYRQVDRFLSKYFPEQHAKAYKQKSNPNKLSFESALKIREGTNETQ